MYNAVPNAKFNSNYTLGLIIRLRLTFKKRKEFEYDKASYFLYFFNLILVAKMLYDNHYIRNLFVYDLKI